MASAFPPWRMNGARKGCHHCRAPWLGLMPGSFLPLLVCTCCPCCQECLASPSSWLTSIYPQKLAQKFLFLLKLPRSSLTQSLVTVSQLLYFFIIYYSMLQCQNTLCGHNCPKTVEGQGNHVSLSLCILAPPSP